MLKKMILFVSVAFVVTGCSSKQRKKDTAPKLGEHQAGQKTPEAHGKATTQKARPTEPRPDSKSKTCLIEGKLAEAKKEILKALNIYKRGCDKDNIAACCYAQGHLYAEESFRFDNADFRKAVNPLKRACALKYEKGCTEAGEVLMGEAEERRIRAVEDGVEAGEGEPDLSQEVVKLKKEALVMLKLACERKEGKGCYLAAKLYLESKGVGGMGDKANYKMYKEKACKLKYNKACK